MDVATSTAKTLLEAGSLGAFIIGLSIFIWKLQKDHKAERSEWRKENGKQFDKVVEVTNKNTSVVQRNNDIVRDLKSILESMRK